MGKKMHQTKNRQIGEYLPSEEEIDAASDAFSEIYTDTNGNADLSMKGALIAAKKVRVGE